MWNSENNSRIFNIVINRAYVFMWVCLFVYKQDLRINYVDPGFFFVSLKWIVDFLVIFLEQCPVNMVYLISMSNMLMLHFLCLIVTLAKHNISHLMLKNLHLKWWFSIFRGLKIKSQSQIVDEGWKEALFFPVLSFAKNQIIPVSCVKPAPLFPPECSPSPETAARSPSASVWCEYVLT